MLGSARPMFETLEAKNSPRCLCPSQRPSGKRDHQTDPDRGERQLELLEREVQQEADVVDDEAERVDERPGLELRGEDGHARLTRIHGVSARSSTCSSPSAVSASATASPPAAKISVLKTSCRSAIASG